MNVGLKILGLIPAKGASKRFPKKNIAKLAGLPLIAWAEKSLKNANLCSRIILSTEDKEVASVAEEHGLEVPFLRPENLGKDPSGVVEVALHALETLESHGEHYDVLIIALPTSPLRQAEDVINAYRLFQEKNAHFLLSVSEYEHSPLAALACDSEGRLTPYYPEHFGKKSQAMPKAFRPNGAIHVLDVKAFKAEKSYFGEPMLAYEMPLDRSVDIDTPRDLQLAQLWLSEHQSQATDKEKKTRLNLCYQELQTEPGTA